MSTVPLPTSRQTIIYDHVRRGRSELALRAARGDEVTVAEAMSAVREYRTHLGFVTEPRPPLRARRIARRNAAQVDQFRPSPTKNPSPRARVLLEPSRTVAPVTRPSRDPNWAPLCMSTDDYGGWLLFNDRLRVVDASAAAGRPCEDCPASFAAEMRAKSMCNGQPGLVR